MVRTVQHPKIVVQENTRIERISKLRPLLHGFMKSKDQAPFSLNDLPEVPSPNTTVSFSLSSISIFKDYIPIRVFNGDSQTIAMTYAGEAITFACDIKAVLEYAWEVTKVLLEYTGELAKLS